MTAYIPAVLRAESDETLVIDACYLVVRVLRNLGRGYRTTDVSTETSSSARELAQDALREIEVHEGVPATDLAPSRIQTYIASLEEFQGSRAPGTTRERAEAILKQMRASEEGMNTGVRPHDEAT